MAVRLSIMCLMALFACDLLEISSAQKEGGVGVCKVPKTVTKFRSVGGKTCPGGFTRCTPNEAKEHRIPRTKCCKMKKNEGTKYECCTGYLYDKAEDVCRPRCKLGCENGTCIAPDVCQCDPPLILASNKIKCVDPVCDPDCVNGKCVNNNVCSCNEGHTPVNATHCTPVCTSGYVSDPSTFECNPKCDSPCINSKCTEPNVCTCDEGYIHKDNFTCTPKCDPTCLNSDCTAPGICSCREGYRRLNETTCTPECNSCENGDCVAPNISHTTNSSRSVVTVSFEHNIWLKCINNYYTIVST